MTDRTTYSRIYAVVKRIPRGRVATYGQVAALAGFPGHARLAGYALRALKNDPVPWHRVVNARGEISPRRDGEFVAIQRALLEGEGVPFGPDGSIPLSRVLWRPRSRTH